jgi:hypothetical protein
VQQSTVLEVCFVVHLVNDFAVFNSLVLFIARVMFQLLVSFVSDNNIFDTKFLFVIFRRFALRALSRM